MTRNFKNVLVVALTIFVTLFSYSISAHAQTSGSIPPGQNGITPQSSGNNLPSGQNGITPQSSGSLGGQTITNPLIYQNLQDLFNAIINAMITVGTLALTAAIIWIGFLFVWARGNPAALQKAQKALFWTVIGGLILLGAKGIELVIQSTVSSVTS